MKIDPNLQKLL